MGLPSHFEPGQGLPRNLERTKGHYRIPKYCTCEFYSSNNLADTQTCELTATSPPLSCKILKLCVTSEPQKPQLL